MDICRINKTVISFFALLPLVLFFNLLGCGGGKGGSPSSPTAFAVVSGKVLLPDYLLAGFDSESKKNVYKSISLYLESDYRNVVNCDEDGKYVFTISQYEEKINIIAGLYDYRSDTKYWQRSPDIAINGAGDHEAPIMTLNKCENSIRFKLKDENNNKPVEAKYFLYGMEHSFDHKGEMTTEPLPKECEIADLILYSAGLEPIVAKFPLLSEDLGPVYSFVMFRASKRQKAPFLRFKKLALQVDTSSENEIELEVVDESKVLSNDYSVKWFCTNGNLVTRGEHNLKAVWKAQSYPGLASISAEIEFKGLKISGELAFEVGGSRTIHTRFFSFLPQKAAAGEIITIKGIGFGEYVDDCKIDFSGACGQVLSWTDTKIEVIVPDGAESGKLKYVRGGQTIEIGDFEAIDYETRLSVPFGVPGASVKVIGYGFGESQGSSQLFLNGDLVRNITKWSNTEIAFIVENSATSGKIELKIRDRIRRVANFTITSISRIEPVKTTHYSLMDLPANLILSSLTIQGDGFGEDENTDYGESAVYFPAKNNRDELEYIKAEIEFWTENEIGVKIPLKAVSGKIKININGTDVIGPECKINSPDRYVEGSSWGETLLDRPVIAGVALDNNGLLTLTDPANACIWQIDPASDRLSSIHDFFALLSTSDEEIMPYAIVHNPNGGFYVTNVGENPSVLKISEDLQNLSFESSTSFDFIKPVAIALDSVGYLYVADSALNKIVILDENLNFVGSFGESGTAAGYFGEVSGVAIGMGDSTIYVSDKANHRVQQFSISGVAEGIVSTSFNCWYGYDSNTYGKHTTGYGYDSPRNKPFGFSAPVSLAFADSCLYVADELLSVVQKIDFSNLEPSATILGELGNGTGQLDGPQGIAVEDNKIYIADSENSRAMIISNTGEYLNNFAPILSGIGMSYIAAAINNDTEELLVLDSKDSTISVFNKSGNFIKKFGSKGSGDGQLKFPSDIAIDGDGNIFVVDTGNSRIAIFKSNGSFESFGVHGKGAGQFDKPERIAIGSDGSIYVSDSGNNRILAFNSNYALIGSLGEGQLNIPMGVDIDSKGCLYVADSGNNRVCKFNGITAGLGSGEMLGWLGTVDGVNGGWHSANSFATAVSGSSPSMFSAPIGIKLDFEDCLYVVDYGNDRVQKFSPNHLEEHGGYICYLGADKSLLSMAIDRGGTVFAVLDSDPSILQLLPRNR